MSCLGHAPVSVTVRRRSRGGPRSRYPRGTCHVLPGPCTRLCHRSAPVPHGTPVSCRVRSLPVQCPVRSCVLCCLLSGPIPRLAVGRIAVLFPVPRSCLVWPEPRVAGASCGRSLVWSDPATRGRSDRLPDPRFVPLWASRHLCVPLSGGLPGVVPGMPVWPRPVQSSPVGTGPVSRPVLSGRVSRVGRAPVSVTVWRRSRAGSPVRYPTVPRYPVESDLSRSSPVQYAPALCPVLSPVGSVPTIRSRVDHPPFATCLRRPRARSLSRFVFL